MRLLLLTPAELTRDVRARRAAAAALERGDEVVGLCGRISGADPAPLDGVDIVRVGPRGRLGPLWTGAPERRTPVAVRELRGLYRFSRLLVRTARLWRGGRSLGAFDVVHANDLETLPAGFLLARRTGARLVYDAHELYSAFEQPAPRLATALEVRLEGMLARRADAVVTVSEPLARELEQLLGLRRPPVVVLNAPPVTDVEVAERANGPLRAVYQGGLGPGRALADLLDAARAPGIELSVRISAADPADVERAVAGAGLADRVRVLEPLPPDRVVEALSGFDVGILFDRPQSRNSELSFPNKLFEYLMAGLAVVGPRLEGIGPLLENERVGVAFDPEQPGALAEALTRLAADRDWLHQLRLRARELAVQRLNAQAAGDTLRRAWDDGGSGVR